MAIVDGIQFSQLVKGMLRMVLLKCGSRNRKFHRLTIFLGATGLLAPFAAGVLEGNSQDRSGPFSQARDPGVHNSSSGPPYDGCFLIFNKINS
jgi:hypothetical protein